MAGDTTGGSTRTESSPQAPTTEALEDVDLNWMEWTDLVVFAVHCRLRGWDEFANAAYLRVPIRLQWMPTN